MIKKYSNTNNVVNKNLVSSVFDIAENKTNKIHNELFNLALTKYIEEKMPLYSSVEHLKQDYLIFETLGKNYLAPSKVILKQNKKPFKSIFINLAEYWPNYNFLGNGNKIINIDSSENFGVNTITNIDFVRGKATFYNKYTDISYEVPLNNIPSNISLDEDLSLSNTFTNLLKASK